MPSRNHLLNGCRQLFLPPSKTSPRFLSKTEGGEVGMGGGKVRYPMLIGFVGSLNYRLNKGRF